MSLKRIKKEWDDLQNNSLINCSFCLFDDQDYYKWKATICGSEGSLYDGAIFQLQIDFPKNYPFYPPKIRFLTPIYHPNINSKGQFYLLILKDEWSPSQTIRKVLLIICNLLDNPDLDSPLEPQIAKIYKHNKLQFNKTVKEWINNIQFDVSLRV